jgi:hypothetical protein
MLSKDGFKQIQHVQLVEKELVQMLIHKLDKKLMVKKTLI